VSPTARGVGLMFVATFFFAAMHGAIRHVSATIHPFEIALFRNLFALVVVLPWFYRYGIAPLRTQRFGLHVLRALFNIVAMLSFFYALSITPLAEVTALNFTAPIFATVLAALVLGEVVRARRWSAIAVGFLGTLIVLRPGFASIGLGQMLALGSALVWSCALLVIKTLGRTDSSATIIAYMGLLMVPLSLVPALFVWQWPDLEAWGWLIAIGVLGGIAQFCMTEALRQADTAVVMPIDFCKLIWVAHNASQQPQASSQQLLSAFDQHYQAIKTAEKTLYETKDRHLPTPEVEQKEAALQQAIEAFLDRMPRVFDPFAGGGAIPLEAARLGCRSYGNDINPVAHIIQKGSLEFPQQYGKPIVYSVTEFEQRYGKKTLEAAVMRLYNTGRS